MNGEEPLYVEKMGVAIWTVFSMFDTQLSYVKYLRHEYSVLFRKNDSKTLVMDVAPAFFSLVEIEFFKSMIISLCRMLEPVAMNLGCDKEEKRKKKIRSIIDKVNGGNWVSGMTPLDASINVSVGLLFGCIGKEFKVSDFVDSVDYADVFFESEYNQLKAVRDKVVSHNDLGVLHASGSVSIPEVDIRVVDGAIAKLSFVSDMIRAFYFRDGLYVDEMFPRGGADILLQRLRQ